MKEILSYDIITVILKIIYHMIHYDKYANVMREYNDIINTAEVEANDIDNSSYYTYFLLDYLDREFFF